MTASNRFYKYVFLLPALLTMLAVIIYPLLYTIRLSVSNWTISRAVLDYNKFANYSRVYHDDRFWGSIETLSIMVIISVMLEYLIGLGLALILWEDIKAGRFLRVLFLMPMMSTPAIISIIWRTMFHESLGPINDILAQFRTAETQIAWLTESTPAFIAVIVAEVWQWTPFVFIMLLAGLKSLPDEPFEAADVDGANTFQKFWYITFPMLKPISLGVLIFRIIEASKLMEIVYVLTGGGPGTSTETPSYYIYVSGLRNFQIGYSAAMSIAYLIIMIIVLNIIIRLLNVFLPE